MISFKYVRNQNEIGYDVMIDNFKYRRMTENGDGSVYYKCRYRNENSIECSASLTILDGEIIRSKLTHNHSEPTEIEVKAENFIRKLNDFAATSRSEYGPFFTYEYGQLVQELCKDKDEKKKEEILEVLSKIVPDLDGHRSRLNKIRKRHQDSIPALPQNILEINLEGKVCFFNVYT